MDCGNTLCNWLRAIYLGRNCLWSLFHADKHPWAIQMVSGRACVDASRCCAGRLGNRCAFATSLAAVSRSQGSGASAVADAAGLGGTAAAGCAYIHGESTPCLGAWGCALLRMRLPSKYQPAMCWAWVVGVETQKHICALLMVGLQLRPCWGCGYGAWVTIDALGARHVRCADGWHLRCNGVDVLVLLPEPPP